MLLTANIMLVLSHLGRTPCNKGKKNLQVISNETRNKLSQASFIVWVKGKEK